MAVNLILREVNNLWEIEQVRVTVTQSLKGGLTVGVSATVGSIILGPAGLLIGGVIGSALTTWNKWGTYKSLVAVLSEDLTPSQQEKLVDSLQIALNQVNREDLLRLMVLIASGGQAALREIVVSAVKDFAMRELHLNIC